MTSRDFAQQQQKHLRQFCDDVSDEQLQDLEAQINRIDFSRLQALLAPASSDQPTKDWQALAHRAEPPPAVQIGSPHNEHSESDALEMGEAALRSGKTAMILVAGGQGTRLGFDQPKGLFPIGPVSGRTLFQMHCDRLRALMQHYQVSIPLFVMTSPATDAMTRAYFDSNDQLGFTKDQLHIFCQGTMPAVDRHTGQILLASKHEIALSPDGHGGMLQAFQQTGCLEFAAEQGIEHLFYAQVDNPLVQVCDPTLIGYHILAGSQLTTQVVKKRFATEKVGNVVQIDGKVQIIEYSDLPNSAAELRNADGSLKLWAGNIAVHVFDRQFLETVSERSTGLPFHRAHKKVPYMDPEGKRIEPVEPNAVKFERFIFDLLPMARRALVVEGIADQVFAPVKNAPEATVDTAATAQSALLRLHRDWLEAAGADVPEGVQVEIHPAWALDEKQVASKIQAGQTFHVNTFLR